MLQRSTLALSSSKIAIKLSALNTSHKKHTPQRVQRDDQTMECLCGSKDQWLRIMLLDRQQKLSELSVLNPIHENTPLKASRDDRTMECLCGPKDQWLGIT